MAYQFIRHPRLGPIIIADHHGFGNYIELSRLLEVIAKSNQFTNVPGESASERARIKFAGKAQIIWMEYGLGILRVIDNPTEEGILEAVDTLNRLEIWP